MFYIGLDLGQMQDYTALAIIEEVNTPSCHVMTEWGQMPTVMTFYHVRHLERLPLGTPYPAIVGKMKQLLGTPPLRDAETELIVDATGVGRPVVDLLEEASLYPVDITITGGDSVSYDARSYRVPKRDLVSKLQVMLQNGQLKIAAGLKEAKVLTEELMRFEVKINVHAHDTYGAWREGAHDDLVLALALAAWYVDQAPAIWIR